MSNQLTVAGTKSRKKTKVSQNLRIFRTRLKTPAISLNHGVARAIKNEQTTRQPNLQSLSQAKKNSISGTHNAV